MQLKFQVRNQTLTNELKISEFKFEMFIFEARCTESEIQIEFQNFVLRFKFYIFTEFEISILVSKYYFRNRLVQKRKY